MPGEFAVDRDIGRDDGDAEGEGFIHGQVEALGKGGREERAGVAQERGKLGIVESIGLMHQTQDGGRAFQVIEDGFILPAAFAHQHQGGGALPHPFGQAPPEGKEEGDVFARLQRADADEKGAAGPGGRRRIAERVFQPQGRHTDGGRSLTALARIGRDIIGGGGGIGDDQGAVAADRINPNFVKPAGLGAAIFRMLNWDEIVDHDHGSDAAGGKAIQNPGLLQAKMADIEIDSSRRQGAGPPEEHRLQQGGKVASHGRGDGTGSVLGAERRLRERALLRQGAAQHLPSLAILRRRRGGLALDDTTEAGPADGPDQAAPGADRDEIDVFTAQQPGAIGLRRAIDARW